MAKLHKNALIANIEDFCLYGYFYKFEEIDKFKHINNKGETYRR